MLGGLVDADALEPGGLAQRVATQRRSSRAAGPIHASIVSDYAIPCGGAEKVAIDSAIGLARAGVKVCFIAGCGPEDPLLRANGVETHILDVADLRNKSAVDLVRSGFWSLRTGTRLAQIVRAQPAGQTVIHVHGWQRALTPAALRACTRSGHPVILTLHEYGTACPNQGFFDYQRGQICTRGAMSADCLTTHCDPRTYLHKLWRVGRTAVQRGAAAVPGGVEDVVYLSELSRGILQPYFRARTRWHAIRNPVGIERTERVHAERNRPFLFIGRVTREKGVQLFADAVASAGVRAVVVGDGPELASLKQSHPQLEYMGWLSPAQVRAALQGARAVVLPSLWYEAQPLVVQEALACGVPTIVADGTAAREIVRDGDTGMFFRHMDRGHLSAQIRALDQDDEGVARMSRRAHEEYWKDPPTLDRHVAALRALYEECLSRSRGVLLA